MRAMIPVAFVAGAVLLAQSGSHSLAWTALVFGAVLGTFALSK